MPDTHSPFRRKATSWFATAGVATGSAAVALSCLVAMSAQAQTIRPETPRRTPAPNQAPPAVPVSPTTEELLGPANQRIETPPAQYGAPRTAAEPTAPLRTLRIEPSVAVTLIGDDNVNLTPENKRRDIIIEVSPRLSVTSQGARHRLNGTVGVDHTEYTQNVRPSFTRPVADMSLESMLVDNAFYLDAGAQVERRAASPFGAQTTGVATDEQIDTRVYRLSPRLDMHPGLNWSALVRSDNTWTNRSGSGTSVDEASSDAYSRRTAAHLNRDPEPFGFGIEGSEESLKFGEDDREVLNLKSARASLGYRVTPQFTGHLLAGRERSSFSDRVQNDNDVGFRMRWAPLERSVLSVEARHRFFGNGFNAQWNHQSRMFSLAVTGSREPVTQPEALRLAGDVGEQFAAIYRTQGYTPAQATARAAADLGSRGLDQVLVQPVTVYETRPQLSTAANVSLTLAGRRTVVVLAVYGRRLEQLRRTDDAVDSLLPGELDQRGTQLSISYRLTPMVSLDTSARYDRSEGTGGLNDGVVSTDTLLSAATSYWLSPHMRVTLGAQRHRLDSTLRPGGAAAANIGTFSVLYRF